METDLSYIELTASPPPPTNRPPNLHRLQDFLEQEVWILRRLLRARRTGQRNPKRVTFQA